MPKQIIVLGTYRSGTSAIAGILYYLGIDMFLKSEKNEFFLRPVGKSSVYQKYLNYECEIICQLNNHLLGEIGISRFDIKDGDWEKIDGNKKTNIKIEDYIEKRNKQNDVWGVKDPRMVSLFHLYEKYLDDYKVIINTRSRGSNIKAIRRREYDNTESVMRLVDKHNVMLLRLKAKIKSRALNTEYETVIQEPEKQVDRIIKFLEIKLDKQTRQKAINSVKKKLKHF